MAKTKLTGLEARIMHHVWEMHPATVKQIHEAVQEARSLEYNTVLTVMRKLRDKGVLTSRREGRQDVYSSLVSRDEMGMRALREVAESFFAGSLRRLVSAFLAEEKLSGAELQSIRRKVDEHLAAAGDPDAPVRRDGKR